MKRNVVVIFVSVITYFQHNLQDHYGIYRWVLVTLLFLAGERVHNSWVPKHTPRKILFVFWMFSATILHMAYVSQLVSQLVRVQFENPIDSSKDLLESGLPLMLYYGTTDREYFSKNPNPVVREVFRKNVAEKKTLVQYGSPQFWKLVLHDLRTGKGNLSLQFPKT